MEEKMKKRGFRVGVLDILILALLVLGIVFALKFSVPVVAATNQEDNMTFVVELQRKEEHFAKSVKTDEKLYENLKGIYLGKVVDVKVEPYTTTSPDLKTGTRKETVVAGLFNVYLTVRGKADSNPGSTGINGYEIAVGKEMFVRTKSIASPGYCTEIDLGGV